VTTGRKIRLPGYRLGKRGLERIPRDASAAKRHGPGASKRIRYRRAR
jgi:hypothetical protein